ncbi:DUF6151 family protein [Cognatishimia maritima]|uniref:CENP-V/GFA domain-containing protein n=1 Tax=Cognatishimia maritima TaxID=870908 RepID=A0A1M5JB38_9RHOB|nr:DUF6151 family protein [Cognatishimia maritima]SHG37794.1 hypothetical protein SAMN04488044_0602 [Cognatishimia maritima]
MPQAQSLSCACGATQWTIHDDRKGRHLKCYCADCQTFQTHLGHADRHLENSGVRIFQTVPSNISFTKGSENLALLRLSPKGTFRWYLSCCNTPFSTSFPSPAVPFCGLVLPKDLNAFGPVRGHAFTETTNGRVKQSGMLATIASFMARALLSRIKGEDRHRPFFDADGAPVVEPHVLTLEERNAARP